MLEIVVLAILVVGVAGGVALVQSEKEAAARTWPAAGSTASVSAPAEEGAPVPAEEPEIPEYAPRKAA